MLQLLLSTITSIAAAFLLGTGAVALYEWNVSWGFTLLSSFCYAVIFNLNLFFIRRWNGCVEKLGGFTFSLFLYLSSFLALWLLVDIGLYTWTAIAPYMVFLFIQIAVIGVVSTIFLRSKNYNPPGPGEFWFTKIN